jgi:hypothetical protein
LQLRLRRIGGNVMRELVVIVVVALIIVFDLTLNDARLFWSVDAYVNALMKIGPI